MINKTVEVTISDYVARKYKLEEGMVYKGTYLGIMYEGNIEEGIDTGLIIALEKSKTIIIYNASEVTFL